MIMIWSGRYSIAVATVNAEQLCGVFLRVFNMILSLQRVPVT